MAQLDEVYYDPSNPRSLGGVKRLAESSRKRKQTEEWLSGQDTYTLHKPARKTFKRRPTIVPGPGVQIQADLIDVRNNAKSNDGINFLLTIIDVFSRKAWVIPIKSKSGRNVADALKDVLDTNSYRVMQTDKGKEFYNSDVNQLLREKNIKHFSTENETIKASIVERFNRTLKDRLYRHMTKTRGQRYIGVLADIVNGYNNTHHSSIGLTPNDVNQNNSEDVWIRLYETDIPNPGPSVRFKPEDYVRITKARGAFERGYTPNWSTEIFQILERVQNTNPIVYRIVDLSGEKIEGTFYAHELQKVQKPELFRIEKIIRVRGKGRNKQMYVKWLGYPESQNSWINASDVE